MIKYFIVFVFFCTCKMADIKAQASAQRYLELQGQLAAGWNTWSYGSMLTHVLLPQGLTLKVNFRQAYIGTPYDPNYFFDNITVDKTGLVRPIAHTFDGSYTELIIDNWYGNSMRIQSAAMGDDMAILITPIKQSHNVPYYAELEAGMMWNRDGTLQRKGETIEALVNGKQFVIRSTQRTTQTSHPYLSPNLAVKGDTILGFYTGVEKSTADVMVIIEKARQNYTTYALKYGAMAEAFKGIQSVLGWNTIYDADLNRVITPVTRGWNEAWQGFVLFEWDTYFASLLFALDNKELAYSNAIAVTKVLNSQGAVGFTQMPRGMVSEQSQPPVGSMICWLIYEKYQDKWFLEEVYNELLSWNRWWLKNRMNKSYLTWGAPWKNAEPKHAILESGLDNSPMYEDIAMNEVGNNSLMNLADVGLNSLYAADCLYLAKIANELGMKSDQGELVGRRKRFNDLIQTLWDDKTGLFLNRNLDKNTFSHRLSPTLFYPMLSGVPSRSQFDRILNEHYYNNNEFYGDYIIPSCARNDKSYNNDYWRGAIWGPMNFLVYMGLRNYDKKAAADLADRSYDLYLKAWEKHHYVFENINSEKGIENVDDNHVNSDPYYHWGALMGIMKFIEENKMNSR